MRDFGAWFSEQGKDEPVQEDDPVEDAAHVWMNCICGRTDFISMKAYKNGDTGWYCEYEVEDGGDYPGLCGSGPRCVP